MYEPRRTDYRLFELLIEALKDVEITVCRNLSKQYFLINVIGLEELILWTLQILINTGLLISGRSVTSSCVVSSLSFEQKRIQDLLHPI